jgi:hypothetical protein
MLACESLLMLMLCQGWLHWQLMERTVTKVYDVFNLETTAYHAPAVVKKTPSSKDAVTQCLP